MLRSQKRALVRVATKPSPHRAQRVAMLGFMR
jgi:hypothetical protein